MTTRRNVLKGAASLWGAAALPAWAGVLDKSNGTAGSVLLFTDRSDPPLLGLNALTMVERRFLSLEIAGDTAHVHGVSLLGTDHSGLVALGTPAAVFALRTQLGSHWRVIAQGLHGADGPGVHRLEAPLVLAPSLSNALTQAYGEDEFAAILVSLAGKRHGIWSTERTGRRLQSGSWDGSGRASLLACPTRSAG